MTDHHLQQDYRTMDISVQVQLRYTITKLFINCQDIVCRYACFKGHFVDRRFGWDCHGLPIEYEIDKKLGIKTKEDFEKIGVKNYNAECRKIVMRYSS